MLYLITKAGAGSATVENKKGKLAGIFTDGDLRRHLKNPDFTLETPVREVMTRNPVTVLPGKLAAEALEILRSRKIDELPVVDKRSRPVGLLDVQDLLKAGIV